MLALQPWLPLNGDRKGLMFPSTIFNSVISFITNTNLQHYAGDVQLSNFSQIFFCIYNMFLSASVGFCALVAIIRAFRGESKLGNYFVDMWRVVVYLFIPFAVVFGLVFLQQGSPMTLKDSVTVATLEPGAMGTTDKGEAKPQTIVVGPVAALESIKMLGTNGGGFFGMNSAHPFENPTGFSNFFDTLAMMLFPFALVLMYGRMLKRFRHGLVVFGVMLLMMAGTIVWSVYYDTLKPNPGLTAHPQARAYQLPTSKGPVAVSLPAVAGLPVDQHLGNLEGKELRFGTSAGAAFDAITTDVTCGAVNAEEDSLNPSASVSPMVGMWLNCIFGGKGVGMINMLLFVILGIFIAGMMVGRTPEYLGYKIGAREMKLCGPGHPGAPADDPHAHRAVRRHQLGPQGRQQPRRPRLLPDALPVLLRLGQQRLGLRRAGGDLRFRPRPGPGAQRHPLGHRRRPGDAVQPLPAHRRAHRHGRLPGAKKPSPAGLGTLRDDTATFGVLVLGTVLIVGALLFLPVAVLGPVAEHLGPFPFGG